MVQFIPPFVVCKIIPFVPHAKPLTVSIKVTDFNNSSVPLI